MQMPDHGDNYIREKGPNGEEIGQLDATCGHHCAVITVGNAVTQVHHCSCSECHGSL